MRFQHSIEIVFSSAVAATAASMKSEEVTHPTNENGYDDSSPDPFYSRRIGVNVNANTNSNSNSNSNNESRKQSPFSQKRTSEKPQKMSTERTLRNSFVSRRTSDDKTSHNNDNDETTSVLDAVNELGILSRSEHRSPISNLVRVVNNESLVEYGIVVVDESPVVDPCNGVNRPLVGADVNFHDLINTCLYSFGCPYDADTMGCWNTSLVSDMSYAFYGAREFNQTIGGWTTSSVTDMKAMFQGAESFHQAIDDLDTSSVTDMSYMFALTESFNQPLGSWQTSNVINMAYMFAKATIFNQPIGSWQTSKVTDMEAMLRGAKSFDQPIETWRTYRVTEMSKMFHGANAFNQPLGSWEIQACQNTSHMFNFATSFNQPIDSWQTSNVRTMNQMFAAAHSFNQPLSSWQTIAVTGMHSMFRSAKSFDQPIEVWQTSNVVNMNKMFHGAGSFNKPLDSWDVSSVTTMESMFSKATFFNQCLSSWGRQTNTTNSLGHYLQRDSMFDDSGCPFVHTSCHWTYQPYPEYCGHKLEQLAKPWCQGPKLQCGRPGGGYFETYPPTDPWYDRLQSSGVPSSPLLFFLNHRSAKCSESSNGSAFVFAALLFGILLPNIVFVS